MPFVYHGNPKPERTLRLSREASRSMHTVHGRILRPFRAAIDHLGAARLSRAAAGEITRTQLLAVPGVSVDIQVWWAIYELRFRREWTFPGFVVVLALIVPLYLLAGPVFPGIDVGKSIDLRAYCHENHRWFFSPPILLLVVGSSKEAVIADNLPVPVDLRFRITFIAEC